MAYWLSGAGLARALALDEHVRVQPFARRLAMTRPPAAVILVRLLVGAAFLSEGAQKFLYPDALGVGRFLRIGIAAPSVMARRRVCPREPLVSPRAALALPRASLVSPTASLAMPRASLVSPSAPLVSPRAALARQEPPSPHRQPLSAFREPLSPHWKRAPGSAAFRSRRARPREHVTMTPGVVEAAWASSSSGGLRFDLAVRPPGLPGDCTSKPLWTSLSAIAEAAAELWKSVPQSLKGRLWSRSWRRAGSGD